MTAEGDLHPFDMRPRSRPVTADAGVAGRAIVIAPGGVLLRAQWCRGEEAREKSMAVVHGSPGPWRYACA